MLGEAKVQPSPRRAGWERYLQGDWFQWFCRLLLAAWLVIEVVPLLYVLGVSLSRLQDVGDTILYLLPRHPTLENYPAVFQFFDTYLVSFWRLLLNNVLYTVGGLLGSLVVACLASFAFATMSFPGKRFLFYAILLQMVMPFEMIMVPEFVTLKVLGLLGGYQAVILPSIGLGIAFPVLVLTAFFRELAAEIFDAAKVDGCNSLRLFWHIALPMSRPALATAVIFGFLGHWNAFALPLIAVKDPNLMNIPLALAGLGQGRADVVPWGLLATAIVVSSIPVTIVFLIFQRRLVEGLAEGALKG